jgi:membrane protease subunit HflK
MAWNDQQPPGKDPWGERGGKNGNRNDGPPDLEELLKRFTDRMKTLFGGKSGKRGNGGGGGASTSSGPGVGGILIGGGVLLAVWLAFDSFHIIDARQQGVVLRFGEVSRILQPGPQFTFPRPIETVIPVMVTQVESIKSEARMLTSDENLVDINFAVQFRIGNAEDWLFKVKDPNVALAQVSESVVRSVVGSRALDEILIGNRALMAEESRDQIQKLLDMYGAGLLVIAVNFQNVSPPQAVKDAFDDAIKAREDAPRAINEAEAYASKIVPQAKGSASQVLQQAEAYKASMVARAQGDARRFELLATEYKAAPEVTRRRLYLETMQAVLKNVPKVLIDSKQGSNGPMLYLPLDKMTSRGGAAAGAEGTR